MKPSLNHSKPFTRSAAQKFFARACHVIESRMGDPEFDTEAFARCMHLSRTQLYRKLKTTGGMSPSTLVREIRLEKAALFLHEQVHTVSQVAFRVGFTHLSYFSKCFRNKYGVLPSDYRRNASRSQLS